MQTERRNLATRQAWTIHEELRAKRDASLLRSARNLISMCTEELRRIDCGGWTMRTREAVAAELRVHYETLAGMVA